MLVLAAVACSLRCAVWMGLATAGEPAAGAQLTLTPADDIQKALDAAAPGDTIVLKDGVYYQSLSITKGGTEGKPLTLRAANGGAATLSGGPPPGVLDKLVFQPHEKDVYRAAVPWEVKRPVVADGLPLYQYKSLSDMMQRKGGEKGGPEDSFRWEGGFLYVLVAQRYGIRERNSTEAAVRDQASLSLRLVRRVRFADPTCLPHAQ